MNTKEYDDFEVMVEDIKKYLKEEPTAVITVNEDKKEICYRDIKTEWRISIKDFDDNLKELSNKKRSLIRKAFKTQEGRIGLIKESK